MLDCCFYAFRYILIGKNDPFCPVLVFFTRPNLFYWRCLFNFVLKIGQIT